jgi:hypothetical protein
VEGVECLLPFRDLLENSVEVSSDLWELVCVLFLFCPVFFSAGVCLEFGVMPRRRLGLSDWRVTSSGAECCS